MNLEVRSSIIKEVFDISLGKVADAATKDCLTEGTLMSGNSAVVKNTLNRLKALNKTTPHVVVLIAKETELIRDALTTELKANPNTPLDKRQQSIVLYITILATEGLIALAEAFQKEYFARYMEDQARETKDPIVPNPKDLESPHSANE